MIKLESQVHLEGTDCLLDIVGNIGLLFGEK